MERAEAKQLPPFLFQDFQYPRFFRPVIGEAAVLQEVPSDERFAVVCAEVGCYGDDREIFIFAGYFVDKLRDFGLHREERSFHRCAFIGYNPQFRDYAAVYGTSFGAGVYQCRDTHHGDVSLVESMFAQELHRGHDVYLHAQPFFCQAVGDKLNFHGD